MTIVHVDFETQSPISVVDVGAMKYSCHPDTKVMCVAYGEHGAKEITGLIHPFFGGEEDEWSIFQELMCAPDTILVAYNVGFERDILKNVLGIDIPTERCYDVAWKTAYYGYPRSLDKAAAAVLGSEKDQKGRRVMLQMTARRGKWDTPEKWESILHYCKLDVELERDICATLPPLPKFHIAHARMDLRMQARGLPVDVERCKRYTALVHEEAKSAGERFHELVGNTPKASIHFREWLNARGLQVPDVRKDTLELYGPHATDPEVKEALALRGQLGLASVAKIDKILECEVEGRVHDSSMFNGADTGRWAGRLIQIQNFARGLSKGKDIDSLFALADAPDAETQLTLWHGGVALGLKKILRSLIRPRQGSLYVADFAQIEARIVNWLAFQEDVLDLFRAYDDGTGPDVYKLNAVRRFNIPIEDVGFAERQFGKAIELGCGFGMGGQKFRDTAADMYRLDLSPEDAEGAVSFYRETHPDVQRLWYDVDDAVKMVIQNPGEQLQVGRLVIGRDKRMPDAPVAICLPSGRRLFYHSPKVVPDTFVDKQGNERDTESIEFWGVHKETKRWAKMRTYGGKMVENATQAIGYDLMVNAMCVAESRGFPPVLTVHDEAGAEGPSDNAEERLKQFMECMLVQPPWAGGLPISCSGFHDKYYRKD